MTKAQRAEALLEGFVAALGGSAPPLSQPTSAGSAPDDAFELYLLGLLVRAAREEGMTVEWETRAGRSPAPELQFLRNPGEIYGTDGITHAIIRRDDDDFDGFEAHIGVRVQGRSGVAHEADVGTITRWHACACRDDRTRPSGRSVSLLVEAKLYSSGPLALGHARALLGLRHELTRRTTLALASNQASASGERLLDYHLRTGRLWGGLPADGADNPVSDAMRAWLGYELRTMRPPRW